VLTALVAAASVAARLPGSVIPRISWWVLAIAALGGVIAAAGSGLALYARSLLLTVLFLALSLLVVWTTRVEELPVAFARIARPLRGLRAPVDEWAHTLALTVRTLPLLRDEIRVLIAARRVRPRPRAASRQARLAARCRELLDLVVAVVASGGRRASDLGRAATQRGGMRSVGH
jgi:energy-coupling factor transport system permease protein